jgi:hypothetical protein
MKRTCPDFDWVIPHAQISPGTSKEADECPSHAPPDIFERVVQTPELLEYIAQFLQPADVSRLGRTCATLLTRSSPIVLRPRLPPESVPVNKPDRWPDTVQLEKIRSSYDQAAQQDYLEVAIPHAARRYQTIQGQDHLFTKDLLSKLLPQPGWRNLEVIVTGEQPIPQQSAIKFNANSRSMALCFQDDDKFGADSIDIKHPLLPIHSLRLWHFPQILALDGSLNEVRRLAIDMDFFTDLSQAATVAEKLPDLTELAVHGADDMVLSLLDKRPGIQTLNISRRDFDDIDLIYDLTGIVRSGVRELVLDYHYFRSNILAELVAGPAICKLESLFLVDCDFMNYSDFKGFLAKLPALKTLDLFGLRFEEREESGWEAALRALADERKLGLHIRH